MEYAAQPPADEYRERLAARRAEHARLVRADAFHGWLRLAVFFFGIGLVVATYRGVTSAAALLAPVVSFAVLVVRHGRIIQARDSAARAIVFYEHGLARIEDRWIGLGQTGERFRSDTHPFANDLDLFGRGSLFELLSIARTRFGEDTLAAWLLGPASPAEIAARQEALRELTPLLDLREAAAVVGAAVGTGVDGDALVAWAEAKPSLAPPMLRWVMALLTAAMVAAVALWTTTGSSTLVLVVLAVQILASAPMAKVIEKVLHEASRPARDLDVLVSLLTQLERAHFTAPRLAGVQAACRSTGEPASKTVASLHRLVEMHDWQHNPLFAPIAAVFLWGTHVAWAIEAWRRAHGRDIGRWLRAVGEFEAISSLTTYRYEHSDDPFPAIDTGAPGRFEGHGLGHPLLPAAKMVRNDVCLNDATRLLVISGSNMSGKSTLLRTVGINVVLALAGGPVRATSLRLTPVALGATLRIQDSLQEGRSRFYAEITRIRDISALTSGALPVLFLLDELFHGTNSHDRLIGATGVLSDLLGRGAMGLITTHDLALTAIAGQLGGRAVNVHFEDWFEGKELQFDYRMKSGPVTRSNALALMRAVGLDVHDAPEPAL